MNKGTTTNKLWTKNFTVITIGSAVSMFGGALSNFALGLIIFERTNSTFLYSFFLAAVMVPGMFMPMIAGPFVDRYSRKKIIYILDFVFFLIFVFAAFMAYIDYFNYFLYLIIGILVGVLSSVYNVAYDSFYPTLISEGNYSKAYSIGSMLYPLANTFMVPVAAVVYQSVGLFPLFVANALSFLVASICEMQIQIDESQITYTEHKAFDFKEEFKEGLTYLKQEKGLKAVTMYFSISAIAQGIVMSLLLPFFTMTPSLGTTKYSFVMSTQTVGRIIGGLIHYKIKYPKDKKYKIALFVYTAVTLGDTIFFFSNYSIMLVVYFIVGILGITSFNIRVSATQSYVPNEKRGRFNGIFAVLTASGSVLGGLIGGALGELIYIPYIVVGATILNIIFILIFNRSKEDVILLYNREV